MESNEELILVLPGTETDRIPLAMTKVEIVFSNEDDVQKCIQALKDSDDQLKKDPRPYDWQFTLRKGLKIYFGVNWYDLEFFKEKRNIFQNQQHGNIFASFNTSAESFVVRHYIEYHGD
ncbi:hypothetical protein NRS6120_16320 [Bacillus subtilis]|nr:hypothetical protein [Bacillus subtilis]CAF1762128.1 hypothetical protein NRS6120_01581 [Bacillus subtilis]CAI6301640.1 hypothetical protein NRS6120_16320 [Bacillus subtilis]